MRLQLSALAAAALAAHAAVAAETGFIDKVFKDADGSEHKYVVYVPEGYTGDKPVPVILFLHGAGETGTDGKKQAAVGLGPAVRKRKDFPFLVVFPQSEKRTWRADSPDGRRAMAVLAEVEKAYKTDPDRVYLTGLSMGGFGSWSLAAAHPDKWAAVAPICGGGDPSTAAKIKHLPFWVFHGDADKAVKVDMSRRMVEALKAAGAAPKYDEYPGVGHNSWDKAYGNDELYKWFLSHTRRK